MALAFPGRDTRPRLASAGLSLRHAVTADMPFLQGLYRTLRADELSAVPWAIAEKHAFLDQQFFFQHRHYLATFPEADFLVVEREGKPVGRLYLDFTPDHWHLIDIGLLTEWRGQGLGSALLTTIQREAALSGAATVILHVEQHNIRAMALYRRLSFREVTQGATHIRMEWACSNASQTASGEPGQLKMA